MLSFKGLLATAPVKEISTLLGPTAWYSLNSSVIFGG